MEIKTKYITPDDLKEYFGIDLLAEYVDDANPSNSANAFIMRVEDKVEAILNGCFNRNVNTEYPNFSDYQKLEYQKALLEQAYYDFKNGDIARDSGYDIDKGEVASNGTMLSKSLSLMCIHHLNTCGLWCTKIRQSHFGGRMF